MRRYLPIVLRAFTERTEPETKRKARTRRDPKWPSSALILDTETTTDPTQRLLFGSYRYCRWRNDAVLDCVQEGIFFEDELPEKDPTVFACLCEYARTHHADVVGDVPREILLMPRSRFVKKKLFPVAYDVRALIVGFNLPFDLTRLPVDWKPARNKFEGGFSLILNDYQHEREARREDRFVSRLRVKLIDSKRSLIAFTRPPRIDKSRNSSDYFGGYFVDARTLAFSLTNEGYPLEKACEVFKVEHPKKPAEEHGRITEEYIGYNWRDVRATKELLEKLRAEFDLHEIDLEPYKARSPASMAKAYLRKMGIVPPAKKFANISAEFLGHAMTSYFGGRAECRIRNTIVPVVYCDFLSMYPTVNALMGLWSLLTARGLRLVDATEEAKRFLDRVSFHDCFKQNTWRELLFFADIIPDADVLPVRSSYDEATDAFNIGINSLKFDKPLCYAGPDLVASKLLSGKVPSVVRAYRLAPQGQQSGLR